MNPVSKMNNRVMFGIDEKRNGMMKRNGASILEECLLSHRLFTDVFMVKSEVERTGSDGLASIQYHAIMAGSSKFVNISLTLFIWVVHRNPHFTLYRQIRLGHCSAHAQMRSCPITKGTSLPGVAFTYSLINSFLSRDNVHDSRNDTSTSDETLDVYCNLF